MSEDQDDIDPTPTTWGQRHGITIMAAVMFGLLAMVMIIQVAC